MPLTNTVRDRGLRDLLTQMQQSQHPTGPAQKIDELTLDNIIREVADGPLASRGSIDRSLAAAKTPEAKLKLAQDGLDHDEAADLKAMLNDQGFQAMLTPASENFLKAVIGVENLKPSLFDPSAVNGVATTNVSADATAAVKEMKGLIQSGKLQAYYDASIGIGDASLKDAAIALFERLPSVHSATSADEMVALGLWTQAPRGIEQMQTAARYMPGRQVIAPAKVNTDLRSGQAFLAYDANGVQANTYRATLVGEKGDNYLIKIDGNDQPIEVSKQEIHVLNQPHLLEGKKLNINGKVADYEDKFMKAKICEAAIKMDELVGQIDFTKKKSGGGVGSWLSSLVSRNRPVKDVADLQTQCVGVVHDVIDMTYRKGPAGPGRDGGNQAGRLAVKGTGVCNEQSGVMAALLVPFQDLIGVDLTMMSGGVYRKVDRGGTMQEQYNTFKRPAHSFIQVTLRPSTRMFIVDRTWRQENMPADRAYSPGGDRFPSGTSGSLQRADIEPTDVVMNDPNLTVATAQRQFGIDGQDGRQNHMSNDQ